MHRQTMIFIIKKIFNLKISEKISGDRENLWAQTCLRGCPSELFWGLCNLIFEGKKGLFQHHFPYLFEMAGRSSHPAETRVPNKRIWWGFAIFRKFSRWSPIWGVLRVARIDAAAPSEFQRLGDEFSISTLSEFCRASILQVTLVGFEPNWAFGNWPRSLRVWETFCDFALHALVKQNSKFCDLARENWAWSGQAPYF